MSRPFPHAAHSAATRRGIVLMGSSTAAFVANDALVKYVSQSLPAMQLVFLRSVMASLLLLAVAHALGATRDLRLLRLRPVLTRTGLDAVATLTFLTALFHLPLANATAINMATPLFITLLAMTALGERVDAARWLSIGVGFAGVLLVVQPAADSFNAYALVAVLAAVLHALRDTSTRFIPAHVPSILITLATALGTTLLSGLLSLAQGWQAVSPAQFGLLAAAATLIATAYYLLIASMRAGEISVVAPFRYTSLLHALVLGYLVWGEVPTPLAWIGIGLLVGAGLHMLHRERLRARAALEAATD